MHLPLLPSLVLSLCALNALSSSKLGKYGHIGILYIRGIIYPKEYLVAILGVCLLSQELISQTDEVRDKTEQTHQLRSETRTPV